MTERLRLENATPVCSHPGNIPRDAEDLGNIGDHRNVRFIVEGECWGLGKLLLEYTIYVYRLRYVSFRMCTSGEYCLPFFFFFFSLHEILTPPTTTSLRRIIH